MWFSLFAVVLILAITFYQGLQGVFSAMIMCILTILAAALAFGVYEDIYFWQLVAHQPDHGRAIALVGVFIISLLVFRVVVDQVISGNVEFHTYVDRAGGGVFGFITAMVIIGTLAIGFQMLPFGPTFLGFSRYDLSLDGKKVVNVPVGASKAAKDAEGVISRADVKWSQWADVERKRNSVLLSPDGFTVGLISHLSDNSLQGRNRFADYNPDFLDTLHYARDGVYRESLAAVDANAISIQSYRYDSDPLYTWEQGEQPKHVRPVPSERELPEGQKRLLVRASITEKTGTNECSDAKKWHFTSQNVRLLGREGKNGPTQAYALAGIDDPFGLFLHIELYPDQDLVIERDGGKAIFNFLFEVPDSEEFEPWLIEYKQNARAPVTSTSRPPGGETAASPTHVTAKGDDTDRPTWTQKPKDGKPKGRVHAVQAADFGSRFSDELPFAELTNYRTISGFDAPGPQVRRGTGWLIADLTGDDEPLEGSKRLLSRFAVPPGRRLLQFGTSAVHAGSTHGKAVNYAARVRAKFEVKDDRGTWYSPVGVYAIADVDGKRVFELQYLDQTAIDAGRLPRLERIKHANLEGNYHYYYLYHLPPGARVTEFKVPRGGTDNVEDLNLVAPR